MNCKRHTRLYKKNVVIRSYSETGSGGKVCFQFSNAALLDRKRTPEYTQHKKKNISTFDTSWLHLTVVLNK